MCYYAVEVLMEVRTMDSAIKLDTHKLEKGVQKYIYLRRRLYEVDVSSDSEYQKTFNGFFRMRQRSADFYRDFYNWMEQHKNTGVNFNDTLTYFYETHHRLEISFSSKLVALIDPQKPIWDSVVTTGHFGLKVPYMYTKNRLQIAISKYDTYCSLYDVYMKTNSAKNMISEFDRMYPNSTITDVKKLDFMLWSIRK